MSQISIAASPEQRASAEAKPPSAVARGGRRGKPVTRSQARAGWLLVSPALLHSTVFIAIPTLAALFLSFTNYDFSGNAQWIGLDNYVELFTDADFIRAFTNTVIYVVVVVPVAMILALLVALGLNQRIRGLAIFRTAFYIPTVTATVAVATVWLWIFNPGSGLANGVLSIFGFGPQPWLTSTDTALPSIMIVGVWQGIGAKMIIYLAALQGVPAELMEAAKLDGANRWQLFRHVTWPAIAPAQFFVLITSIVSTFQVFDLVYVMTQGGPAGSTNVLVFDIYRNAFQELRLGYASAETVVLILLVGAFIAIGARLQGVGKK